MKKKKTNHNKRRIGRKALFLSSIVIVNLVWLTWLTYSLNQQKERIAIHDLMAYIMPTSQVIYTKPPIDKDTGDVYFPEMKLKINQNEQTNYLLYSVDNLFELDNSIGSLAIRISTTSFVNSVLGYSSKNVDELVNVTLPKYGSCQRGIRVSDTEAEEDDNSALSKSEKILSNGKKIYLSYEKQCSELGDILDSTVKTIDSY